MLPPKSENYEDQDELELQCRKTFILFFSLHFLNLHSNVYFVINVKSGQTSKISCQCHQNLGYFSIFVGCKWKLEESNCPNLLFSLASNSADFDDSFINHTFTGDSSEEVQTTSAPTLTTQARVLTFFFEVQSISIVRKSVIKEFFFHEEIEKLWTSRTLESNDL